MVRTAGLVATVSVMRCTLATPAAAGGLPEGTSVTRADRSPGPDKDRSVRVLPRAIPWAGRHRLARPERPRRRPPSGPAPRRHPGPWQRRVVRPDVRREQLEPGVDEVRLAPEPPTRTRSPTSAARRPGRRRRPARPPSPPARSARRTAGPSGRSAGPPAATTAARPRWRRPSTTAMSPFDGAGARRRAAGRSLASTPASRKTITNAHHATPRTAHAPMRAIARDQHPVRPPDQVPPAEHQRHGDDDGRVEQQPRHGERRGPLPLADLAGDGRVGADARRVDPRARDVRVDEGRERPSDEDPQRDARGPLRGDIARATRSPAAPGPARSCHARSPTAATTTGASRYSRGDRARTAISHSRTANRAIPNSCGRSASAGAARANAASARIGRRPRARPALPRRRHQDARREGDQPRTQHRQQLPPADGVARPRASPGPATAGPPTACPTP